MDKYNVALNTSGEWVNKQDKSPLTRDEMLGIMISVCQMWRERIAYGASDAQHAPYDLFMLKTLLAQLERDTEEER